MTTGRKTLLSITRRVEEKKPLAPTEINTLLSFEKVTKTALWFSILKKSAVPLSLFFGFLFSAFPAGFKQLIDTLPAWTNFSPPFLQGVDYLWDLIGDPVRKANVLYHIPNLILYSFGILGLKKLLDTLERRSWLDRVLFAQKNVREQVALGKQSLRLRKGHSLLFVGKGDFIGAQFTINHKPDETITISESKPLYTQLWCYYNVETLYEDLKNVILRAGGDTAGEYVFFPVKDDQIFLPGAKAYDLSPHRLDILCQNIRVIEREQKWKPRRIIVIGDKFHRSFVHSEDRRRIIPKSADTISLTSIAKKYEDITLLDPSDIVIKKIIAIAKGRKIVFRATREGITEYKVRFYERLKQLGYKQQKTKKGILTIGYDIFEDQTEQQTLSHKIDDYFPVVLSKNVHDALIRNGYKKQEFLYVPDLVLEALSKTAEEQ